MGMLIAIVIGILVVWGLFEIPEFVIPFIIIVFVVGACVGVIKEKEEETETETTETTEILVANTPATEDSIHEQCVDGILYLLIVKDGQNFMAPKENRYGDNKRCQTP